MMAFTKKFNGKMYLRHYEEYGNKMSATKQARIIRELNSANARVVREPNRKGKMVYHIYHRKRRR